MHTSYAMMASRIIPPTKDKEAKVDGVEEVGGVVVLVQGRLNLSWPCFV